MYWRLHKTMTVKEIVNLLPKGYPVSLEIDNITYKDDCAEYNRVLQEYGDYIVTGIDASFGVCDDVLWLKVERKE